jgi:hypothetical protein
MTINTQSIQGLVGRFLTNIGVQAERNASNAAGTRVMTYGEQGVQNIIPDQYQQADEGCYYTAGSAPGASALGFGVSASFAATSGFVVVQNSDPVGGRNLHMKYIRFESSVAPASGSLAWFAAVTDQVSRTPSAGQVAITPVNVNTGATASIGANVWFPTGGAVLTVPAAGANAKTITGNLLLRGQIPVVGDEYTIGFGNTDLTASNLVTAAPNGASCITKWVPPIVLAPQHYAVFYLWFPSNSVTGISFGGLELGYVQR